MLPQRTLAQTIELTGVGLHSGRPVQLRLCPAPPGHGLVFVRTDLQPPVQLPVDAHQVQETLMSSGLVCGEARIGTVEHLMAALAACGIDNLRIEVDAAEIPIMDGSAEPFIQAIVATGWTELPEAKRILRVLKPVRVEQGDKWASLEPGPGLVLDFEIDFGHPAIAATPQRVVVDFAQGHLLEQFGRARTFGFLRDLEQLHAQQLALGGSLDNAIVVGEQQIENPGGLRQADEFVRHKVLDAVGDLYLAGLAIEGHYRAYKSGHALNNQLLRALLADSSQFEIVSVYDTDHIFAKHLIG